LAVQPFLRDLAPILASAAPRPVTPFYPMVSQILQSEFSAIIAERRSPQTALRSAERQLDPVLQLDPL
jgi:multiple sugar transport system substrate-binding protein